jgi:hypothetical protein
MESLRLLWARLATATAMELCNGTTAELELTCVVVSGGTCRRRRIAQSLWTTLPTVIPRFGDDMAM